MKSLRLLLLVPALLVGTATASAQGVVIRAQPEQQRGGEVADLLQQAQKAYEQGRMQVAAELMAKAQALTVEANAEMQEARRRDLAERQRAERQRERQEAQQQREREATTRWRSVEGPSAQGPESNSRRGEVEALRARVAELEAEVAKRRGELDTRVHAREQGQRGPQAPVGPSIDSWSVRPGLPGESGDMRFVTRPEGGEQGVYLFVQEQGRYVQVPHVQHDAPAARRGRAAQDADPTQRLLRGIHEELRGIREELSGIRKSLSGDGPQAFGFLAPQGAGGFQLHGEAFGGGSPHPELFDGLIELGSAHGGERHLLELEGLEGLEGLEEAIELELETIFEQQENGDVQIRLVPTPQVEVRSTGGDGLFRVRRLDTQGVPVPPAPEAPPAPAPLPVKEPRPLPQQPDASSAFLPMASASIETR